MPLTQTTIEDMVETIVREVDPEQIILFGSHARGDATDDSDIDLLIVEREPFGPGRSRYDELKRIRRILSSFRGAKDILVYSEEEIDRWRGSLNHIISVCLREGQVLYGRS